MSTATGIRLAAVSDVGRVRDQNEDRHLAWAPPPAEPSPLGVRAVLAVADGIGGQASGEVASELAIAALRAVLTATEDRPALATAEEMAEYLRNTVSWINQQVAALGQADDPVKPGTTLTVLVIHHEQYVLAHVGDSRAYRVRHGAIEQLTEDHSYVGEQVRARRLTPEMARTSPFRSQLTRSIGTAETVEVDLKTGELAPGDRLLVCSDGLTEHLREAEIAAVINNAPGPEAACRRLVELALERGGADNVTAVLGQYGEPAPTQGSDPTPAPFPSLPAPDADPVALALTMPVQLHHSSDRTPHRLGGRVWVIGGVLALLVLLGLMALLVRGLRHALATPAPLAPAPVSAPEPPAPTPTPAPPPAPRPANEGILTVAGRDDVVILTARPDPSLVWSVTGTPGYRARALTGEASWEIKLNGPASQPHRLVTPGAPEPAERASLTPEEWTLGLGTHELRFNDVPIATVTLRATASAP